MNIQRLKYKSINAELALILALAFVKLVIHLYTNAFAGYGIFRDELYYLACASRPDFGYVDQPPYSIWILGIIRFMIGDSVFVIRLLPAVLGAGTVFLTGLIVTRLGGGKFAILIASLALIFAPIYLAMNTIYSMNSFDIFLWALAFYFIILIVQQDKTSLWIWFGIILGVGLLNKVSFLWLSFGFYIALLITDKRKLLKTIKPWITAGIAFLFFLPFIIWNTSHDWAHIEFIRNAQSFKYSGITRWDFLKGILLIMNPASAIIWLLGLYYLFSGKKGTGLRILGIIFITTFLILFVSGKSKSEYIAPAFIIPFATGGLLLEKINQIKFWGWFKHAIMIPLVITGIMIAPLALPILSVEKYINYADALGFGPTTSEGKELAELPQFYADMFGWEELAKNVSAVYEKIPENEREKTIVFGNNYGEAGAIEYFSEKYSLPPVISVHNNFWIWGWKFTGKEIINVIILGGRKEDHLNSCSQVEVAAIHKTKYSMPYENNLPIFICRGIKEDFHQIWERNKNFN